MSLESIVIHTKNKLTIRPIEVGDFEFFCELQTDELVRKFLGGPVPLDTLKEKFDKFHLKKNEYHFVVERSCSQIGLVSLNNYKDTTDWELSFQFLPRSWGCGVAFESCFEVINLAFHKLGILEIFSETQVKNISSRKLIERLGMVEVSKLVRFREEQVVYKLKRRGSE